MKKVLHLDSSVFFSKVINDICKTYDLAYTFVKDSKQAMEVLKKENISMIISSIKLKKEDAEKFLKEVKSKKSKEVQVLMISSDKRPEYKDELLNLGADYFVYKDLSFDTVMHKHMSKLKKREKIAL